MSKIKPNITRLQQSSSNNRTTDKQIETNFFFRSCMEPINIPQALDEDDDAINMQTTFRDSRLLINGDTVVSPDRSLLKKKVQIVTSTQRRMDIITDKYYNGTITDKTFDFLQSIKGVILKCSSRVDQKRAQILALTIIEIRNQWATIKQHLAKTISDWCDNCENYEVTAYKQRGQYMETGVLPEMSSKLTVKLQEIQQHKIILERLATQQQRLKGPQLSRHLQQLKDYIKCIWNKDYQFQIHDLQREVSSILSLIYPANYRLSKSVNYLKEQLHMQLDQSLQSHVIFKPLFQGQAVYQSHIIKRQSEEQINRSNQRSYRHQVPDSRLFLNSRSNSPSAQERQQLQLSYLQLKSEREWQTQVKDLIRK